MITENEKMHYLAVKKLSALFSKIISKHDGVFHCLNGLHLFRTENEVKEHKNVCKNHDHCYTEMPKEESILKHKHGEVYGNPFIIYAHKESLLQKIYTYNNNPEKSSTTKKNKYTASGYSLFTPCSFDVTKNKPNHYRGKDCMKNFCKYSKACNNNKL